MEVIITEIKHSGGFHKHSDSTEGRLNVLENRLSEKCILCMLLVIWKYLCNTCATGVSEVEMKQHRRDEISEKIMAENFPKLKMTSSHISRKS